jgi:hypothetical protein
MSESSISNYGLRNLAIALSSLVIAVPLLASGITEAVLKTLNPAGVDITQDLAYLREILGFGFGSLGVLLIAIIVVYVLLARRTGSFAAVRLPLLIFVIQVVVGVLLLATNGLIHAAEDIQVQLF